MKPQSTDLQADPQLTAFERSRVRAIVGLSTELHDNMRALSDRRSSLLERERDLNLAVARAVEAQNRHDSDEGLKNIESLRAQLAEIKDAYRATQGRYEELGREAQAAGVLADRLLQHLGLRADGDDVLTMDWGLPGTGRGPKVAPEARGAKGDWPVTVDFVTGGVARG